MLFIGCGAGTAAREPLPRDGSVGIAPSNLDPGRACGRWHDAVLRHDRAALRRAARPELSPSACYVRVRHGVGVARADPIPHGCGYPEPGHDVRPLLLAAAERIERADGAGDPLLACPLPHRERAFTAARNARVLRALARRLADGRRYAYGAVSTFGYGHPGMARSRLVGRSPEEACVPLSFEDARRLDVMVTRAGRAAAAYHGGVAPVVIASGGAVASPLVEAFALDYLLRCWFSVPSDRVLLDVCADHTHTNLRNTGALLVTLGARTGYVVTDDGFQGQYLAEPGFLTLIGGSVEQRALADWGYSLGGLRRASTGVRSGFWYTPYPFWAEPRDEAGGLTCVR